MEQRLRSEGEESVSYRGGGCFLIKRNSLLNKIKGDKTCFQKSILKGPTLRR